MRWSVDICLKRSLACSLVILPEAVGGFVVGLAHFRNDFLQALDLRNSFHPEPLKITGQRTHERPLVPVQLRQRLWIGSCLGIVLKHSVNRMIERNQQDTSLAMISARTRMAVLI